MKKHTNILEDASVTSTGDRSMVFGGALTGVITRFSEGALPVVVVGKDEARREISARSCVPLGDDDVGREVVLVDDQMVPGGAIVVGLVQRSVPKLAIEATADGRAVTVRATESITLKCGEASITLKADGTVAIRGNRVVTHATGVNRIRGGSVELN